MIFQGCRPWRIKAKSASGVNSPPKGRKWQNFIFEKDSPSKLLFVIRNLLVQFFAVRFQLPDFFVQGMAMAHQHPHSFAHRRRAFRTQLRVFPNLLYRHSRFLQPFDELHPADVAVGVCPVIVFLSARHDEPFFLIIPQRVQTHSHQLCELPRCIFHKSASRDEPSAQQKF